MDNAFDDYIIDFGGVLVGLDRRRCIDSFSALGVGDVDKLINYYYQGDLFGRHERGEIGDTALRDARRAAAGAAGAWVVLVFCLVLMLLPVGADGISDDAIDAAWDSFLTGVPRHKLETLRALRQAGRRVWLLSNTNNIHWQYALTHYFNTPGLGIDDCFDGTFLSYVMKMAKPDPDIFREVIRATGAKPGTTLFVDDSEANCRSAASLGIHTLHAAPGCDWTSEIIKGME